MHLPKPRAKAVTVAVVLLIPLILRFLFGCASNGGTTSTNAIISANSLSITTSSLPNGQIGIAYVATLAASGGTPPYNWTLSTGALPTGLSLNAISGAITGTPTTAANSTSLTFMVSDSSNPVSTKTASLTLTISSSPAPLAINTASLPNGQVNTLYATALAASGGTPPYSWSLVGGTLPAGLSLNASSGAITGTPTTATNGAPLTFMVSDSSSPESTKTASLT